MSTLDNFQLGEVPAKPSNHDDGDVRPIQVDLRYKHRSCDGSMKLVQDCCRPHLTLVLVLVRADPVPDILLSL